MSEPNAPKAMPTAKIKASTGSQDGFAEVLIDELCAVRADDFSHTHFLGAFCSACCGKINKIETGNENDEEADHTHHVNIRDVAVRFKLIVQVRPEVNVSHLLNK